MREASARRQWGLHLLLNGMAPSPRNRDGRGPSPPMPILATTSSDDGLSHRGRRRRLICLSDPIEFLEPRKTLGFLRPNASQCKSGGTRWVHRLPSHISKTVPPTIHLGPLKKTRTRHRSGRGPPTIKPLDVIPLYLLPPCSLSGMGFPRGDAVGL